MGPEVGDQRPEGARLATKKHKEHKKGGRRSEVLQASLPVATTNPSTTGIPACSFFAKLDFTYESSPESPCGGMQTDGKLGSLVSPAAEIRGTATDLRSHDLVLMRVNSPDSRLKFPRFPDLNRRDAYSTSILRPRGFLPSRKEQSD